MVETKLHSIDSSGTMGLHTAKPNFSMFDESLEGLFLEKMARRKSNSIRGGYFLYERNVEEMQADDTVG